MKSDNDPRTNDVLTIELPSKVEIDISGLPVKVEYALITKSGRVVPSATRVNPTRKLLILNFFAKAVDWSMKISADLINTIR